MVASLLFLALMLWMAPVQSRRLGKSGKQEKFDEAELPQDVIVEEFEDDEDRILPDDEIDPCVETLIVYSDPDDLFFDPDLMQVVMLDVS